MAIPSTEWKEQISADEAERFQRQGEAIRAAHALKNARYGKGRFLHRKPVVTAEARLDIADDLPAHARHGVFASPGSKKALVRLSNGAFDVQANARPDIRGFALRILDVEGEAALGGTTDHQDFLLINHDSFASKDSDEFVEFATLAAHGQASAIWTLFRTHGLAATISRLKTLAAVIGKPFAGFAAERFNTVLPHRIGPYAAKLLLVPTAPSAMTSKDPGADIMAKLNAGPIEYRLCLQFYTDETSTPLEDHRKVWDEGVSSLIEVGRLTLLKAGPDLESLKFDPWGGLEDHRPLGEIMRARKSAYYISQKARLG
jgi:hypothetical protein